MDMISEAAGLYAGHDGLEFRDPHEAAVDPSRHGARWCKLAAGFFLLQATGAFTLLDRMAYGEWSGKSGDKLTQILNLVQIGVSVALFVRGYLSSRRLTFGAVLAIALTAFLFASSLWSIEPDISARRGFVYFTFVIGAIGIAETLDGDEFMDLMRTLCVLSAALTLLLLVVAPAQVLTPGSGELRGNFSHKNIFGQIMAAGVLATLHGLRAGLGRLVGIGMIIVFTVEIVLAKSGTSLMSVVAFCAIDLVVTLLRRGGSGRVFGMMLVAVLVPAGLLMVLFPDLVLGMLGKDPTLTGRTVLWQYVELYISQRPVLGWGLTAFWSTANPLANGISATLGWVVPEAHNGVLELLLEVGVVGTCLFVFLLVRNLVLAFRCLATPARELAASSLLCHVAIVLVGVSEQVLIDPSTIYVSMFFIMGFMCDKASLAGWGRSSIDTGLVFAVDPADWQHIREDRA